MDRPLTADRITTVSTHQVAAVRTRMTGAMFRNVLTCGHASLWHPREPTNFPADCALKASPLSTRLPYSAMMPERSSTETSIDSIRHHEKESLIESYYTKQPPRFRIYSRAHIVTLYVSNAILLLIIAALVGSLSHRPFQDPTIGVYCTFSYVAIINQWLTQVASFSTCQRGHRVYQATQISCCAL